MSTNKCVRRHTVFQTSSRVMQAQSLRSIYRVSHRLSWLQGLCGNRWVSWGRESTKGKNDTAVHRDREWQREMETQGKAGAKMLAIMIPATLQPLHQCLGGLTVLPIFHSNEMPWDSFCNHSEKILIRAISVLIPKDYHWQLTAGANSVCALRFQQWLWRTNDGLAPSPNLNS